jgi:hypothetical protein
MKLNTRKQSQQIASVLMVTLLFCVIIGTTLASYLLMAQNQNLTVMRSQNWNTTLSVTEAGVEDALQMLNNNPGTFDQLTNWTLATASDNWSALPGNVYHVTRYLGSNYYDAYITNVSTLTSDATIYSVGTVPWSYYIASAGRQPMFAATGVTPATPSSMTRGVAVKTKIDPLFNVAMAALLTINLNGNNIDTDSFDSMDPNYSTNGLYPLGIASMTKANGDVVTDDTIINSLNVGNANIKGHIKTGPNGTISIGPNGAVGDRAWVEGGSMGIEPGWSANDMNVLFPNVTLPSSALSWLPASPTTGNGPSSKVNNVQYDYIIRTSGDYSIPGGSGGGNGGIYIGTNANVRLIVTGNLSMTGQSQLHIAAGGSLSLYMDAASCSLGGNGVINENGNAASFYYFGLPVNTSLTFAGNATFVGAVYAPEAAFTLSGGGVTPIDFIGGSVTKSVTMNGHYHFHYDENLRRNGMGRGYIPTNWKES